METKKVLGIIFSLLFVGAFAFVLSWGIINFNKVKDGMSGTGIYTKEDINKSYEDGYNTALTDKEEYTKLIASYRDTITTLNDNISQLNSQVTTLTNNNKDYANQLTQLNEQKTNLQSQVDNLTTIKSNNETTIASLNNQITSLQNQVTNLTNSGEDKSEQITILNEQITNLQKTISQLQTTNELNTNTITSLNTQIVNLNNQISEMTLISQNSQSQINALNNKITELQKSVTYYESYIASLENGEQVVATFEFDGSVYNIQIVNKGSKLVVTNPTSTTYKIFNGWTVNGETIDLSTYTINANTKIVADVTYKYDVKFMVYETTYNSQIVTKNACATLPTNPTKDGYEFDGWSLNGVDLITDIESKQVTENTTYIAVFTKLHTVTFVYENETKSTQIVRNGSLASSIDVVNTQYKVFNGWAVDNTIIDLSNYKVFNDTTFVANITYKYDVIFKVDDTNYNSQLVVKNGCATLPSNPTKDGYEFDGWSINGVDVITDISSKQVTANTTYVAVFTKIHTVTFMSDGQIISTQAVRNGGYATLPTNPTKDGYEFDGWSLNGVDVISDIASKKVMENTTYFAKFSYVSCVFDGMYLTQVSNMDPLIKSNNIYSLSFKFSSSKTNLIGTLDCGIDVYSSINESGYYELDFVARKIYAPIDCSSLFSFSNFRTLDLSNFDTSNVTNMEKMFYECGYLTSLNLSNFDTSNVTNMKEMFSGCIGLKSLDVSNFDTSNVTNMRCMFFYCLSLKSLNVSSFDTSKVTDMSFMFNYLSSLTTLNLSNFDTRNVTEMTAMFGYNDCLTSIEVGVNYTLDNLPV